LNSELHALSIGKPSEWKSNFWTVQFLKTESEQNFGFFAHPYTHRRMNEEKDNART